MTETLLLKNNSIELQIYTVHKTKLYRFLRGKKWRCWDSDFQVRSYTQCFPPSFFETLGIQSEDQLLCVFTNLGFELRHYSGARA